MFPDEDPMHESSRPLHEAGPEVRQIGSSPSEHTPMQFAATIRREFAAKDVTGTFCRNGPSGAPHKRHKRCRSPFAHVVAGTARHTFGSHGFGRWGSTFWRISTKQVSGTTPPSSSTSAEVSFCTHVQSTTVGRFRYVRGWRGRCHGSSTSVSLQEPCR